MNFKPEYLKRWTLPCDYFGAEWPEHFVFFSQNRDSDSLTRSNFRCALKALGGEKTAEDGTPLVSIVRESHWAVGWVEWIAIHESNEEALRIADELERKVIDIYPVVDENDWSEEEQREADSVWRDCYSQRERVEYVRKHRDQFEFHGLRDAVQCLRGEFFGGWACELVAR